VPGPTGLHLHDTLVGSGSAPFFGTHATGAESSYQAPFDDFTATGNAMIRTIEWQGYYCNRAFTGSAIPDPVATQFVIRIAPNDPGANRPPFAAFRAPTTTGETYVAIVRASSVRQQLETTRLDSPCGSRNGGDPASYYTFSTTLTTPFPLTAGRKYWVSIVATLPSVPVSWHWRFGRADNSASIYCLCNDVIGGTTLTTFASDRAFALWDR
jgi:hypothetical protein